MQWHSIGTVIHDFNPPWFLKSQRCAKLAIAWLFIFSFHPSLARVKLCEIVNALYSFSVLLRYGTTTFFLHKSLFLPIFRVLFTSPSRLACTESGAVVDLEQKFLRE